MNHATIPTTVLSAQFDRLHTARAHSTLPARLYAVAMGDDYPDEVAPSSSCDWPLLELMATRLHMHPRQLLVDAGCGTGGIGLWLARALAVRLEGIDISPAAIEQATARRSHFAVPATFRVADLENTGLPDGRAHGVVCVDALSFTTDRVNALRELGRILDPDGRLLVTRAVRHGVEPRWSTQVRAAGLVVEHVDERPAEPAMWARLYQLWIDHAGELRRELGDEQTQNMLREAHTRLPTLPGRRAVLLTLRRP
ncbi:class I SAM-dependent methyltransferase [Streptomyces sp. NPDC047043]|uniref:class I SAM-dependent methyltransferase n=1 Tax=Streptomyces sp. NPDC047043 TaxID=3154497 RepID=UPI0033D69CCA